MAPRDVCRMWTLDAEWLKQLNQLDYTLQKLHELHSQSQLCIADMVSEIIRLNEDCTTYAKHSQDLTNRFRCDSLHAALLSDVSVHAHSQKMVDEVLDWAEGAACEVYTPALNVHEVFDACSLRMRGTTPAESLAQAEPTQQTMDSLAPDVPRNLLGRVGPAHAEPLLFPHASDMVAVQEELQEESIDLADISSLTCDPTGTVPFMLRASSGSTGPAMYQSFYGKQSLACDDPPLQAEGTPSGREFLLCVDDGEEDLGRSGDSADTGTSAADAYAADCATPGISAADAYPGDLEDMYDFSAVALERALHSGVDVWQALGNSELESAIEFEQSPCRSEVPRMNGELESAPPVLQNRDTELMPELLDEIEQLRQNIDVKDLQISHLLTEKLVQHSGGISRKAPPLAISSTAGKPSHHGHDEDDEQKGVMSAKTKTDMEQVEDMCDVAVPISTATEFRDLREPTDYVEEEGMAALDSFSKDTGDADLHKPQLEAIDCKGVANGIVDAASAAHLGPDEVGMSQIAVLKSDHGATPCHDASLCHPQVARIKCKLASHALVDDTCETAMMASFAGCGFEVIEGVAHSCAATSLENAAIGAEAICVFNEVAHSVTAELQESTGSMLSGEECSNREWPLSCMPNFTTFPEIEAREQHWSKLMQEIQEPAPCQQASEPGAPIDELEAVAPAIGAAAQEVEATREHLQEPMDSSADSEQSTNSPTSAISSAQTDLPECTNQCEEAQEEEFQDVQAAAPGMGRSMSDASLREIGQATREMMHANAQVREKLRMLESMKAHRAALMLVDNGYSDSVGSDFDSNSEEDAAEDDALGAGASNSLRNSSPSTEDAQETDKHPLEEIVSGTLLMPRTNLVSDLELSEGTVGASCVAPLNSTKLMPAARLTGELLKPLGHLNAAACEGVEEQDDDDWTSSHEKASAVSSSWCGPDCGEIPTPLEIDACCPAASTSSHTSSQNSESLQDKVQISHMPDQEKRRQQSMASFRPAKKDEFPDVDPTLLFILESVRPRWDNIAIQAVISKFAKIGISTVPEFVDHLNGLGIDVFNMQLEAAGKRPIREEKLLELLRLATCTMHGRCLPE